MNKYFNTQLAQRYQSVPQQVRVMSEHWVERELYCPNCGAGLRASPNNNPVGDFGCYQCQELYELKSSSSSLKNQIADGAYSKKLEVLRGDRNPNFLFLSYCRSHFNVVNLVAVPKHFFVPEIIRPRKALAPAAKRAGWVGSVILLGQLPSSGKVYYIRDGVVSSKPRIMQAWHRVSFMREIAKPAAKSWTLDMMSCIDRLSKTEFTLAELYAFERELAARHPANTRVRAKIRQQLQFLRAMNYLENPAPGKYRLVPTTAEKLQPDSWTLNVKNCIASLANTRFTLQEIYAFDSRLQKQHPDNQHIKAKIRQQLQILRDQKYLVFLGNGKYERR